MSEPLFLGVEQIASSHKKLIDQFGGIHGLRDAKSLEGAAFHPQNEFYYGKGDLFDIAAAYAFHIAQAQAFLDGNKRAGMAAALTFLEVNGVPLPENTSQLFEAMISIAEKRMNKEQLAATFRRLSGS